MSVWKINEKAKTNGRNALMVCHTLSLAPIAEIKMPYIPNGTTRATPDIEGQKKIAELIAAAPDLLRELIVAHLIIRNAALIMEPEQLSRWVEINNLKTGTLRHSEREVVITKAEGGAA